MCVTNVLCLRKGGKRRFGSINLSMRSACMYIRIRTYVRMYLLTLFYALIEYVLREGKCRKAEESAFAKKIIFNARSFVANNERLKIVLPAVFTCVLFP